MRAERIKGAGERQYLVELRLASSARPNEPEQALLSRLDELKAQKRELEEVTNERYPMNPRAALGLSILLSLVSSAVVAVFFAWPWLQASNREEALIWLVAPHMFLRFIGIGFLIPGVVSGSLPRAWAIPAAYGDLIAGLLAIVATIAMARTAAWAILAVWVFNVWGAADLLFAFYKGARIRLEPGSLGATFYIVTAIVPPLLISHTLIFALLMRTGA